MNDDHDDDDDFDPLLEAEIDAALAAYRTLLPPEVLAEFRENLADFATTHPTMQRMVERLHPAPVVGGSHKRRKGGAGKATEEAPTPADKPKPAVKRTPR